MTSEPFPFEDPKFNYHVKFEVVDLNPGPSEVTSPALRIEIGSFDRVHMHVRDKHRPYATLQLDVQPFHESEMKVVLNKDSKRKLVHVPATSNEASAEREAGNPVEAYPLVLGEKREIFSSIVSALESYRIPRTADEWGYRFPVSEEISSEGTYSFYADTVLDAVSEAIRNSGLEEADSFSVIQDMDGLQVLNKWEMGIGLTQKTEPVKTSLIIIRREFPDIASSHLTIDQLLELSKETHPTLAKTADRVIREAGLSLSDLEACAKALSIQNTQARTNPNTPQSVAERALRAVKGLAR